MKTVTIGALLAALLLLASCAMSPAQQATALQALDQMLAAGSITLAQFEALREGVLSSGQGAWWEQIAQVLIGAGLAYVGVQVRRGPPTRIENLEKAVQAKKAHS